MKQLDLPAMRVCVDDLATAMDAVFGPRMLRSVHGDSLEFVTGPDFDAGGTRSFRFSVDVPRVPGPVRRFFCGDRMAVTTTQTAVGSEARVDVSNELQLHFKGARLFKLRPQFWLEATSDGIYLGGRVRHDAMLFPPLNRIAESFMMRSSEKELRHFGTCLAAGGVI